MAKAEQLRIEKRFELKGHKLGVLHDNSEASILLYARAEACHKRGCNTAVGGDGTG